MLTYTELALRDTFLGRYRYVKLGGAIGVATFSFDRHLNQAFYQSRAWKQARDIAIIRDEGCDLGIPGREIHDRLLVHHMNPIKVEDLKDPYNINPDLLNAEYLICVSTQTHNAIHFGDESQLPRELIQRMPGDTDLW